ncbi:hypothetical protein HPB52_001700 [Rhipicephalus sanguineus]|uniref:Uncharacterized protein n=1 Tax=Rhipicephalus sanguineus TaxID=34632 RepID=A0A9D4SMQ3_RHISA|nr:hypothetical protein HPB52_001700 [Rhipicephalus sanguineus]
MPWKVWSASRKYTVSNTTEVSTFKSANSIEAVQTLLETGGLHLGTRTVPLVPVARQAASVTCLYLPCYVPDNEVVTGLMPVTTYGTTLRIEEARYKDRLRIPTGTRRIEMDMRQQDPLPKFARVGGHRATPRVSRCASPLPPLQPRGCGVFGHRTDTWTEPCRRCGGAHASVEFTARKTYSMAAAMDVDEFPTLGAAPAAGQTQCRLTTLHPAKRLKPNEDGPEPNEQGVKRGRGDDDSASAVTWASVDDMVVRESGVEEGPGDGKEDRSAACKGSQGERKLGLKGKTGPQTVPRRKAPGGTRKETMTTPNDKHPNSSVEQEKSVKAPGGEDAPKQPKLSISSRQQPLSESASQYGGATQQRDREGAQHGVQHGEAEGKPSRKDKMATAAVEAQKTIATSSSDELEPCELVINERAPKLPDSMAHSVATVVDADRRRPRAEQPKRRLRRRPRRNSLPVTQALGPGTKKVRRDVAGRLRGRTAGREHEQATSKQHPSKKPVADDMDTDSDIFLLGECFPCFPRHHVFPRPPSSTRHRRLAEHFQKRRGHARVDRVYVTPSVQTAVVDCQAVDPPLYALGISDHRSVVVSLKVKDRSPYRHSCREDNRLFSYETARASLRNRLAASINDRS